MAPLSRPGLVEALRQRELESLPCASFRAAAHAAAVPSHAFLAVRRPPPAVLRRYTPCGRFLVAVDRNRTDLRMYRLETGGLRAGVPGDDSFLAQPMHQNPVRAHADPHGAGAGAADYAGNGSSRGRRRGGLNAYDMAGFGHDQPHAQSLNVREPPGVAPGRGSSMFTPSFNVNPFLQDSSLAPPMHLGRNAARGDGLLSALPVPPGRPPPSPPPAASADFSSHSCEFSRFFSHVYTSSVATGMEVLVPDFCLATAQHVILASVIAPTADQGPNAILAGPPPAVAGVRVVFDRITFHLVNSETGQVRDKYVLDDDFVALEGHAGVHMFGDLLCVLSIRQQTLHLLRVHDATGRLMSVSRIGAFCNPDDELEIARARDAELRSLPPVECSAGGSSRAGQRRWPGRETEGGSAHARNRDETAEAAAGEEDDNDGDDDAQNAADDTVHHVRVTETGLGNGKSPRGFYGGLMHRLLVYVHRKHLRERNERLFFRVIGQYSMLVMKKAQLLDEDHLLIRLGSSGMLDPRNSTCFLLVYCLSTSQVVNLYENRSAELLELYESNSDLFTADSAVAAMLSPVRGFLSRQGTAGSRGGPSRENPTRPRGNSSLGRGRSHIRTREILAELPVSAQDRNASVYLNRRLFSYPVDRLPALDGSRAMSMRELHSIKFTAAGGGNLRFKLTPGLPNGEMAPDGSGGPRAGRRKVLFLFHPTMPFVISMQASQAVPTSPLINFHVRDT